ncbi:MAG: ABC transporter permease subunit, partial [Desulfobacteraceae bacterium]
MDRGRSPLKSPGFHVVAGLVPAAFLGVFYFYPLSGIFIKSFFSEQTFRPGFLPEFFSSPRIISIIWFTIWQAALSTLLTFVFALPCAHVMARYDFFGKRMVMILATIPFVLPTVVVAAAFRAVGGAKGFVPLPLFEHPLFLILLAHVFYNFSVVLRIVSTHLSYIRHEVSEAAYMLGASGLKTFFRVTLPMLRPSIFASCLLVFIFCFSSFGVILILGGPGYSTIEVEIFQQAVHMFNLPAASLLSIVQIMITFAVMYGYTAFQKKTLKYVPESESLSLKRPSTRKERVIVGTAVLFVLI